MGLSTGLHLLGLVALPTLLGWGWWEWRQPKSGAAQAPVTLHWAAAPSLPSEPEPALERAPEILEPTEFEEPEIDWPVPLPQDSPAERNPEPREAPQQDAEVLPRETTQVPLTPVLQKPGQAADPVEESAPPEPSGQPASTPPSTPAPEPERPEESSTQGEPIRVDWSPVPWSVHCPEPPYSARFQRRGWQGTVTLALEVEVDGRVTAVSVIESSGYGPLDEAARETLATWRFQPGPPGSQPTTVQRKVEFRLP